MCFFELLRFKNFCDLFQPTSERIRTDAVSELLETLFFSDYDLESDENLLWKAHYGLPVYTLIYIKRFINNVPKGFVNTESSNGIMLAAIVSAR